MALHAWCVSKPLFSQARTIQQEQGRERERNIEVCAFWKSRELNGRVCWSYGLCVAAAVVCKRVFPSQFFCCLVLSMREHRKRKKGRQIGEKERERSRVSVIFSNGLHTDRRLDRQTAAPSPTTTAAAPTAAATTSSGVGDNGGDGSHRTILDLRHQHYPIE